MSKAIKGLDTISKIAGKIVDNIFQLDRLDDLSKGSIYVRVAHAECICLINYVLLAQSEIQLEQIELFGITLTAQTFPPTLEGKLDALSLIFAHVAGKLDDTISTMNASTVLSSVDFIADIAKAALTGTRVSQLQGLPPGYGIKPTYTLKKPKP